jgi:hypothetical protein
MKAAIALTLPLSVAAAADALAANHDITLSAEYAQRYKGKAKYFAAFLLWYSIYNTYAGMAEIEGDKELGGDMFNDMNRAAERAEESYGKISDLEHRIRAEAYYRDLRI